MQMPGMLYLVATPIGNLGDISLRAIETLRQVDFIAAEDTRVTLKLLNFLEIKKQLVSFHEHSSRESGEKILTRILNGESCALVTDAGMPCISDPGEDITRMCGEAGVTITVIPGPCAAVTALALSGLPSGRFVFEGFLSTARKSRFERLEELKTEERTMIFYEAPHKLMRTLHDMLNAFGDRRVSISRELTKLFEETRRFTLSEAVSHFEESPPRGEFVLIIEGTQKSPVSTLPINDAVSMTKKYIESGLSVKDAVKTVAEQTGVSKNTLYNAVIKE
ncbi:MAG: 16S rRNA (cytidine(1402)-2'-O)-methyltransferase [Oscillospiraceae bacterium]|nr:16S rRNA (cytidine(1402)-2'-O)-methyltransferase [Oscillospiraceae bacterium]